VHRDDQIRPFTDEQIKALLAAKRLQHPKRNEALLLLMCDTGLRASEVCGLTVGDLDLDKATSGL
jgi:integrase